MDTPELLERLSEAYRFDAELAVSRDVALALGRQLVEQGFKKVSGVAVKHDTTSSISSLVNAIDNNARYQRDSARQVANQRLVVGPYYAVVEGEEFCPRGLGLWQQD